MYINAHNKKKIIVYSTKQNGKYVSMKNDF